MAHRSFWKLLSPGKTGAVTHDHMGPPPTPPIPSLQVVEGRTPLHPGVASDLVCVLHFISVQFFKQIEDLLQLCISALLPMWAHCGSVTVWFSQYFKLFIILFGMVTGDAMNLTIAMCFEGTNWPLHHISFTFGLCDPRLNIEIRPVSNLQLPLNNQVKGELPVSLYIKSEKWLSLVREARQKLRQAER